MKYIVLFIGTVSVLSIIMTIYDKLAAKNNARRISEKTLLLTGLLGGATAMFITMKTIRHKTRHMKFMITLPIMSVLHIAFIFYLYFNIT